jgi:predicted DNA-binding protein
MPISIRLPFFKEEILKRIAKQRGKTKTAIILEAIDEKLGLKETQKDKILRLAGWMSSEEAAELQETLRVFEEVEEGDYD